MIINLQRTFPQNIPFTIVLGNEKGGTGKSTLGVHLAIGLMHRGFRVAVLDLDGRQGTFSRFMDNRKDYSKSHSIPLMIPYCERVLLGFEDPLFLQPQGLLEDRISKLYNFDYIFLDTPGSHTPLGQEAHVRADMLITPMNDSYIDLDVLVHMSPGQNRRIQKLSSYAEVLFEMRKAHAARGHVMEWIIVRNRLSHLSSHNTTQLNEDLLMLSKRLGFKLAKGFGERVIFRQLFLLGVTVLDLEVMGQDLNLSHVAARKELKDLLNMIPEPKKMSQ
jgi:chromosome partitioning protein